MTKTETRQSAKEKRRERLNHYIKILINDGCHQSLILPNAKLLVRAEMDRNSNIEK